MAAKYWIKLYHEILRDPKMGRLPDRTWRRAIELFLLAGESGDDGLLPDTDDIAWQLRVDAETLQADLETLAEHGIVTETEDGWLVTNFEARQGPVPGSERVARYRERKRKDQYDGNGDVTSRYTEPDTDTEPEPESAALSSFIADSVHAFENCIGLVVGETQTEEVKAFLGDLHARGHPEWWQLALDVACDNNARKWSYVRAVLQNWLKQGRPGLKPPSNGSRASPEEYDEAAALEKAARYGLGVSNGV